MTESFITKTLTRFGVSDPMDKWITLYGNVQRINTINDRLLLVNPTATHFYFDTTRHALYLRKFDGKLYQYTATHGSDYYEITIDGTQYLVKLKEDYITDSTHGAYHTIITFDKICSFHMQHKTISDFLKENY